MRTFGFVRRYVESINLLARAGSVPHDETIAWLRERERTRCPRSEALARFRAQRLAAHHEALSRVSPSTATLVDIRAFTERRTAMRPASVLETAA